MFGQKFKLLKSPVIFVDCCKFKLLRELSPFKWFKSPVILLLLIALNEVKDGIIPMSAILRKVQFGKASLSISYLGLHCISYSPTER
jgi:hypothetical protein